MLASRNDFSVGAMLALSAGFIAHLFSPSQGSQSQTSELSCQE
jgi:hypothetical protein